MEAIVGVVVAFAVAQGEPGEDLFPESVEEYRDPKEAFTHSGVYFKKIRRSDGGFSYNAGFHDRMKVGDEMYGYPCSKCKTWTWWDRRSVPEATHRCDACSERHNRPDVDIIEQYDHES